MTVGFLGQGILFDVGNRVDDGLQRHLLRGMLHLGAALNLSTSVDGLSVADRRWDHGMPELDGIWF